MPNLTLFSKGDEVAQLHTQLQKLGYDLPKSETSSQSFGVATRYALLQFQNQNGIVQTGEYDEASRNTAQIALGLTGSQANVQGQLFLDNGKAAEGISLNVYRRDNQGKAIAIGKVQTDAKGFYSLPFDMPKEEALNLEITAVKLGGKAEIALHQTKYNAAAQEVLNLVVPTQDIVDNKPEHARLINDLIATKRVGNLADIKEDKERQDISYLAQSTNWNGKNIALVALAAQRSADSKISQEVLYGLFRAGLPTGRAELAQVSTNQVVGALKKASAAGIIAPMTDADVTNTSAAFESFARTVRWEAPPPGGISSFGSLLSASGLKAKQQVQFETILLDKPDTPAKIWENCAKAGFTDTQINTLKTQGKLGHLTRQSLPLMQALQTIVGNDPDQLHKLVDSGFHEPQKWVDTIMDTVKGLGISLDKIVPDSYLGLKIEDKLKAYTEDLARKVRVAYPTDVIYRKIIDGRISLGADEPNSRVKIVLEKTVRQFRFGAKPIRKFIKEQENVIFPPGTTQEQREATIRDLERLHRLHQLTPTDEAMQLLLTEKINSAEDIFKYGEEPLVGLFRRHKLSEYQARLTYRKAVQIHAIAFNFLTLANEGNSAPGTYVTAGAANTAETERTTFRQNLIRDFPTLETLFGSTDFCECEHCRSVLSPAAYFVDLLRFLDTDTTSWNNFKAKWKEEHGADFKQKIPYEALIARRPDLPALPLTCENTNIALPTIDLVNEILEFFIVHKGALQDTDVYDTGAATTPELLAEPQHLSPAAYDELKKAVYPIGLPFDLWLETARRFYEQAGITFAQGLDALRDTDQLFRPAVLAAGETAKRCYRAEVFTEELNISQDEYAIFTESDINANWFKYYGYEGSTSALALADLVSAKKLSRRLGVTYKELADLLRTGFINPNLDKLAVLPKLGISIRDVFQYKGKAGETPLSSDEKIAFEKRLDALTTQFSASGFKARIWLDKAYADGDFNNALILADPNTGCNFDLTTLRFADGKAATAEVFHKINIFIRLWKKLGWTMEETDRALQTFFPKQATVPFGKGMQTALVYLAHLKMLDEHLKLGKNSRLKWLSLWSDLATTGKKPLYAQLFLTASALKNDKIFDDPLGNYLPDPSVSALSEDKRPKLADHFSALQSVLGLSANDISALMPELPNVYLSLANVSALYRHALLSKALKIQIADLLILKKLTGLNPFKQLELTPLVDMNKDYPQEQTLRFIEAVEAIKASGFSANELDFLFNNAPSEKFSSKQSDIDALFGALKTGFTQIAADFALPTSPREWTNEAIGKKFALITVTENNAEIPIAEEAAMRLLKLWNGTAETDALQAVLPQDPKEILEFLTDKGVEHIFDKARNVHRFVYKGYLPQTLLDNIPASLPASVKSILQQIRDTQRTFLTKTLGALNATDFNATNIESLFAPWHPSAVGLTEKQIQDEQNAWESKRRDQLAKGLLVPLQTQAIKQFIVKNIAAAISEQSDLVNALLINKDLMASNADATQALWTAFQSQPLANQQAAFVALRKAVLWITGLNLSIEEVAFFNKNKVDFDGFDLNLLHTKMVSPVNAQKLTVQLLRFVNYIRIRSDLQTTGDKLIAIFQQARQGFPAGTSDATIKLKTLQQPCTLLADLLGKSMSDFSQLAEQIGFNVLILNNADGSRVGSTDLTNEIGLGKLLKAFGIKEKLRASVTDILLWSRPNPDSNTIINLRNTIKGLYDLDAWLKVAQPIFDRLRRQQRDALVAFVLYKHSALGFNTLEELYEFLLIDTGMEPIVQTSRLRQAIAAVQLFIQRSLLNLETQVNPSTINTRHWEWMKRYRVWEANRKIFLYPENWLEPEFRDDKTHLYKALESEVLQGDISNDTAERAFFNYLKGLEQISRLEMVSMYLEEVEPTDPSSNTLHIIGRTHNKPHAYFYRRYQHEMWTPWEPIDAEIESDHVVAVKWRDRLHLFWVMFMQKPIPKTFGSTTSVAASGQITGANITALAPDIMLQAQLNWVEFFQGEWKGRQSTDFRDLKYKVSQDFNARTEIFIHASKATVDGIDALNIHIDNKATFKLVSKLTPPQSDAPVSTAQELPFNATAAYATKKIGKTNLTVKLETETSLVQIGGSITKRITEENPIILGKSISDFTLLTTSTPFHFGDESVGDDRVKVGGLMRPFFYEDNQHTFFVEPTYDEVTIERWEEWTVPEYVPGTLDSNLGSIDLQTSYPRYKDYVAFDPAFKPKRGFGGGDPIDPRANFIFQDPKDWLTNPQTLVHYGDVLVSNQGGFSPEVFLPQAIQLSDIGILTTNTGGSITANTGIGKEVVLPTGLTIDQLKDMYQTYNSNIGFTVVTKGGFGQMTNFNGSNFNGGALGNIFNKNIFKGGF